MRHTFQELDQTECDYLLSSVPIGRLGFDFGGHPMVLPVAFRFVNREIVFRTSAGVKLHAVASNHPVAFEADYWDEVHRTGWSVLVHGHAQEIENWEEFQDKERLGLLPWADEDDSDRWVKIVPERTTGRRIIIEGE